ncbi:MAG: hypothetical protein KKA45_01360, partial [Alphaproteobacteria bacterium]|nr:hypothetical protein [Alphaproteobacteria bacterium]
MRALAIENVRKLWEPTMAGPGIIDTAQAISRCYEQGWFPPLCYKIDWRCSPKWCGHYGKTCKYTR